MAQTMESGSIARWSLKEGDKFGPGTAICEVETDKATVTYEATDEGYLAKILVGSGEVKVGQPLMVTVEDPADIPAFASFALSASQAAAPSKPAEKAPAPAAAPASAAESKAASPAAAPSAARAGDRVFASPFARKLARESGVDISTVRGTGPNGRIIADDVLNAPKQVAATTAPGASAPAAAPGKAAAPSTTVTTTSVPGVYTDFELSDVARAVASRMTAAKQHVPHYYVSIDINMAQVVKIRSQLNAESGSSLSVLDFTVKAAAAAMRQVPDLNGSWQETFVRRYEQVDINLVMGNNGTGLVTPIIRDVGGVGLKAISNVSFSICARD
jgi:pyruvate dehydrogenase E2 component (dihydrolipoamide acetyltransferase)